MGLQFLKGPAVRLLVGFLFSLLLYWAALHLGWFSNVDQRVYDAGLSLRPPLTEPADVVLVAIDKQSVTECFPAPAFPVSRHLKQHTELVRKLSAAGSTVIVFDVLFDSLTGVAPQEISRFATALGQAKRVVLAVAIEKAVLPNSPSGLVVTKERLCLPAASLRSSSAGLGLINMPVDPDGYVRRCYLSKSFRNRDFPSLSYAAARLSGKIKKLPESEAGFYTDYASYGDAIPRIPYVTVLKENGWESLVKDKVALVGVAGNGSIDTYKVPLASVSGRLDGKMSGAEIQAIAIQTLLSGTMMQAPGRSSIFGIGALILLGLSLILSRARPVVGLIATLVVLVLTTVGALISTAELSLVFPVGALAMSAVGVCLAMFTMNLVGLRGVTEKQEKVITDIRDDLKSAHVIYENLQPREFHLHDNVQVSAMQIPCKEVGGDYYDIVPLPNASIGVLIADVSGKGVSGSLIMSNLQGRFRHAAREVLSPAAMLREFNESVGQVTASKSRFVTLFYGVLDCKNLALTYSNAGHCYPIVCSPEGQPYTLAEGGPLLGPFPDLVWADSNICLGNGDVLCLYTDGITEAGGDEPQKQFGEERIIACLREKRRESAESIKSYILERCQEFVGGKPFDDDWTLLVLKMGRK